MSGRMFLDATVLVYAQDAAAPEKQRTNSLILAAAASAGCSTVLSEDMNPGQVVLGVKVQNPFA